MSKFKVLTAEQRILVSKVSSELGTPIGVCVQCFLEGKTSSLGLDALKENRVRSIARSTGVELKNS